MHYRIIQGDENSQNHSFVSIVSPAHDPFKLRQYVGRKHRMALRVVVPIAAVVRRLAAAVFRAFRTSIDHIPVAGLDRRKKAARRPPFRVPVLYRRLYVIARVQAVQ